MCCSQVDSGGAGHPGPTGPGARTPLFRGSKGSRARGCCGCCHGSCYNESVTSEAPRDNPQHILQLRDGRCFDITHYTPLSRRLEFVHHPGASLFAGRVEDPFERILFEPTYFYSGRGPCQVVLWGQTDGPDMTEPPRRAVAIPTPAFARLDPLGEATRAHGTRLARAFDFQADAF